MIRYKRFAICVFALLVVLVAVYGCTDINPLDPFSGSESASSQTSSAPTQSVSGNDPQFGTSGSDVILLPEDTVVSVVAFGDNLIHPSVYYSGMEYYAQANGADCDYVATHESGYDFLPIYEHVADAMSSADVCFINQETLSGGPGTQIDGYPKFNTPDAVAKALSELGVDIINMAHNHMLDSGSDSLLKYSDGYFRSLGMTPLGYYENEADTSDIVLYEEQGITFAFLTYTYSTNGISSYSETYIPYFEDTLIRRQVALAKENADVVIVSAHWGYEDAFSPNSTQKYYASLFCELGVDVVIGTHSHCLQPMEWMVGADGHKMLLTYSLGNFVSGMQNALNVLEGMLSFDVRKSIETGKITIETPVLTPLVLHYEQSTKDGVKDTGYRRFKLYELKEYTETLAAAHGVVGYEAQKGTSTLYGGKFSIANMYETVRRIIPAEFLPEEYR